jgi:hypothetical protein
MSARGEPLYLLDGELVNVHEYIRRKVDKIPP